MRDNPKLSGTKHNVFGIQTGVAIAFMVRVKGERGAAAIRYARRPEDETAADKLAWLSGSQLQGDLSLRQQFPSPMLLASGSTRLTGIGRLFAAGGRPRRRTGRFGQTTGEQFFG